MVLFLCSLINCTVSDYALAWDLHAVLFDVDLIGWIKLLGLYGLLSLAVMWLLYTLLGMRGILFVIVSFFIVTLDFCSRVGSFAWEHGHRPVIEHVWDADPLLRFFKPIFVQFENLYAPNEAVFEIVKNVKKQGYSVYIASNIAPDTLRCLRKKYPDYFALFDGIVSPSEAHQWVDKKQPERFFELLKNRVGNKNIVFIDDSLTNCKNAEKYGIKAICFQGDIQALKQSFFDKFAEFV